MKLWKLKQEKNKQKTWNTIKEEEKKESRVKIEEQ